MIKYKNFSSNMTIKLLSAAALMGIAFAMPGYAEANALLTQKPITAATLDYLRGKGVLIPQEGADSILAPESAYRIVDGTADNHTFEYKTIDENDNISTTYYTVELKNSKPSLESLNFGTSKNVTWTEVNSDGRSTITLNFPNNVTKYYKYSYTTPEGYEEVRKGLVNPTDDIKDTIFFGITSDDVGVISNSGTISNITANFTANIAPNDAGAIYNKGIIKNITGDFIRNSTDYGKGGAIYNSGTIENITGDFIDNSARHEGGAIYNNGGTIVNITGGFIGNSTNSYGGAIDNYTETTLNNAIIGNITGDFIGNSATKSGGAIDNYADSADTKIDNIKGDFIGNSAGKSGGAIYNYADSGYTATITNITANFFGNSATEYGGAIYNNVEDGTAKISNITGNFINNSAGADGGAIYNKKGTINNITGNFVGNSATGTNSDGGAIDNDGIIENIVGDFIGNNANRYGGAIENYAESGLSNAIIGNIIGDFIGNSAGSEGGAIFNIAVSGYTATISNITGNFIGNSAGSEGGAIYSVADSGTVKIYNITGNFIGNSSTNYSGAIENSAYSSNTAIIENITGDFIGNTSKKAGAILNYADSDSSNATIKNITGNFIGNSAVENAGAIYNSIGTIETIKGDFIGNTAGTSGGAIYNIAKSGYTATISNITANFIGNNAGSSGGAIYNNSSTIENITGDFISNITSKGGGAIYNYASSDSTKIGNITGNFIENSSGTNGGAIYNTAKLDYTAIISNITGDFIKNSATGANYSGGAIYNKDGIIENISGSFVGNRASQGGAIWTNKDLTFTADAKESVFKDNYTESEGVRDDNAIYVDSADATIYFNALNSGKFEMYDNIRGAEGYSVNITGDGTGSFGMYNDMYGANVSIGNVNLNTVNGVAHTYNLNSLTLTGDVNATVDVDLANRAMDRFSAASYGEHDGTLNIVGMNLLSDAAEETTNILFADKDLKDNVATSVKEVAYSPIYKYDVSYDNTEDGGYFVFNRGAGAGGNSSDGFNPAVLSAPVSNIAAAQATVNETFKYVFEQADAFTQMPALERQALIKANLYALSTDYNENLGALSNFKDNKAGWFRAYSTIENMDLRHGPKVDAITYGSLVGFDTDFHSHKDGWYSVGTGYVGYNGNLLSYNNVDTTMNGGLLGYTHTMYKNNF